MCAPTPLEGVEPIAAPHAGVLVFLKELGAKVQARRRHRRPDRSGQRRHHHLAHHGRRRVLRPHRPPPPPARHAGR
ncbi:hypothetical protein LP420_25560 [Massilia sp. B-10]|nr:hypothetical protein LP420_25560 [Massilia sp. B-10]